MDKHFNEKISNSEIISKIKSLVGEERRTTNLILNYLQIVETRRLYAEMGYPSLFEFCTRELGYSAAAAYRRIESMRLLKSLPLVEKQKIEESIHSGKLSLSQLASTQKFLKTEKKENKKSYSPEAKLELLQSLESKSARETEVFFISKNPAVLKKEKERVVSEEFTEIKLNLDQKTLNKLKQIKDLISHKNPNPTYAELIEIMAENTLQTLLKNKKTQQKGTKNEEGEDFYICKNLGEGEKIQASHSTAQATLPTSEVKSSSRYIPLPLKRQVWARDQGRCTYQSSITKHRCHSTYLLQIDHIYPFALGGSSTDINNLRLLCASHNQLQAQKQFGAFG